MFWLMRIQSKITYVASCSFCCLWLLTNITKFSNSVWNSSNETSDKRMKGRINQTTNHIWNQIIIINWLSYCLQLIRPSSDFASCINSAQLWTNCWCGRWMADEWWMIQLLMCLQMKYSAKNIGTKRARKNRNTELRGSIIFLRLHENISLFKLWQLANYTSISVLLSMIVPTTVRVYIFWNWSHLVL